MPILLVLLVIVLVMVAWQRRNSTLTRNCRWRLNRLDGDGCYTCVSCGAKMQTSDGKTPTRCLAAGPK